MGDIGEDYKKRGGRPQSGVNVLQGGDTGATTIWIRDMGTISRNEENGGKVLQRVSETNHRKPGVA